MAESSTQFVVCIKNDGYEVSLEIRKIYLATPDPVAEEQGFVRIVDESGEDYLYPRGFFQVISLSPAESKAILAAA